MQYFLLMLVSALGSMQTLLNKRYSMAAYKIPTCRNIFTLVNAVASGFFYAASVGFSIDLNEGLLFWSALYAAAAIAANFYTIFVYTKVSVAKAATFSSGGALCIPYIVDVCFLGGEATFYKTAAVVLLLLIFLLPFADRSERQGNPREYLYCTVSFFLGGMGTVICKLFTLSENPLGSRLFCFWTNVIMIPTVLLVTLIGGNRRHILPDFKNVGVKNILTVITAAFIGCVGTPLMLSVIGDMNVTVYTIASSSLSLIFAAVMSVFVFREHVEKRTLAGIVLAVGAVVLSAL